MLLDFHLANLRGQHLVLHIALGDANGTQTWGKLLGKGPLRKHY